MSYWVLTASGIPIAMNTVQRVTNLYSQPEQCRRIFDVYDNQIAEIFNEKFISANEEEQERTKPSIERWEDLAGDDEVFHKEFAQVITNGDTPEADNKFNPKTFNNCVNMELSLDIQYEGP